VADAAFAPVPGYTFEDAPESVISDVRAGFEEGMKSSLKMPGITLGPGVSFKILSGVSGRVVSRNGEQVAAAVAMKFDDQWRDQLDSANLLAGAASKLGGTDQVTVAGTDAIISTSGGTSQMLAYKDGTFLIVIADSGDRATLTQVMAGLIANLG